MHKHLLDRRNFLNHPIGLASIAITNLLADDDLLAGR